VKIYKNVRGTMKNVASIEANTDKYNSIDTVYIRSNIVEINEENFKGWEYDEIQYGEKEYIEKLSNEEDTGMLALIVSMLMSEVDMLKVKLKSLEGGK